MRHIFLGALLISFWFMAIPAFSQAVDSRRGRLSLDVGLSQQSFAGVEGATVSSFRALQYGAGLFYKFNYWDFGIGYSKIPGVKVDPFTFKDATTGQYQMDFTRTEILAGLAIRSIRFHLFYGLEQLSWSGSPELGATSKASAYTGAQMIYLWKLFGPLSRLSVPLSIRYLQHPERKIQFAQKVNEDILVAAGSELGFTLGVSFAF